MYRERDEVENKFFSFLCLVQLLFSISSGVGTVEKSGVGMRGRNIH